jgi:phenylalanyl-tRNA synthetase beta chain
LKNYLKTIGLRPINNVVDITNFVLFETGQALHAFDADRIDGGEVHVRNLPEGTPFVTLDGVERKLSADDLMICGKTEALCIGGVFGGLKSGVTENTKNVFLESACFNPVGIRKTARRHGLNTDASFRFERGVDPDNTVYTLKRAALLIKDVAGGEIASEIIDHYPNPVKPFDVELSLKKTYKVIGKEIGKETVETILKALEIEITDEKDGVYQLKVPPYRVDVQRDVDVIEDILRIYGYNSIELSERVKSTLTYNEKPNCHKIQHLISEQLTAQGFNEIMNNSLTKSTYYEPLASFPVENCARIMNPLSSDLNVMRQTLLFGGLESIVRNINRKRSDLKFYEFGNCYYFNSGNKTENNHLAAYSEDYHLGIWLTGNKFTQSWIKADEKTSVFELKAYVENIFRRLGFNLRQFVSGEYADDLLSEALNYYTRSGKQLAVFGVVHPAILKQSDIEQPVFFADLNLSNILSEIDNRDVRFREISKYPEVRRDLSLLIDKETTFAQIEHIARQSERNLLKKVTLFDVYEGKNLEPGKKSYAVNFVLEDETKTLNDKQIDTIMHKIQTNLEKQLNAKLR